MANGAILDTNCFSHVFNRADVRHNDFSPFLEWLISGSGYLVYGGTKYKDELQKATKYLKLFSILNQYNKAIPYNSKLIDQEMERIVKQVNNTTFDDPHLAAIVVITKSRVICSGDSRSFSFLKRKDIYNGQVDCPKFYTGIKCSHLLKPRYVGKKNQLNNKVSNNLYNTINKIVD